MALMFNTYLKHKEKKLPLWLTLLLILSLSLLIATGGLGFSTILVAVLFCFTVCFYGESYWKMASVFLIMAITISLMTFNTNIILLTFFRVLAYTHISFLFAYLCPPTSFKNKAIVTCLVFLPYFENEIELITQSARIKGLNIKSKNPYKFVKNGAKLIIPLFVILTKTIEDVEVMLKVKGFK